MFLKKCLKYIGILSLFCAGMVMTFYFFQSKKDLETHYQIIHKNKIRNQNYTEIPYIEIPKYQVKRILKETTDPTVLNQNYVGIWNKDRDLRKINHIVLAGHNIKNVFAKIHQMEKDDEIILHYKDKIYYYKVVSKKIIGVTELKYLEETGIKQITLITCTGDDQKRMIVIGQCSSEK